jgi:hypothetical protein
VFEARGDLDRAIAEYRLGLPGDSVYVGYEPSVWRRLPLVPREVPLLQAMGIEPGMPEWQEPYRAYASALQRRGRPEDLQEAARILRMLSRATAALEPAVPDVRRER